MSLKGELAQMVERSLSMREVPGSMPGFSIFFSCLSIYLLFFCVCIVGSQNDNGTNYLFTVA